MTTATKDLHLISLRIKNFLAIEAAEVNANGNHVIVSGPNGTGKTSVIDSLAWAMGCLTDKDLSEPIRHGEKKASVVADWGEFTVERTKTAKKTVLDITLKDGSAIDSKPQAFLDQFINTVAFDPGKFLEKSPKDQREYLLALCKVAPPVDLVEEISGVSVESRPNESASAYLDRVAGDNTGIFYTKRKELSQALDRAKKSCESHLATLTAMPEIAAQDDVSKLLVKMDGFQKRNAERMTLNNEASRSQAQYEEGNGKLKNIVTEYTIAKRSVDDLKAKLAEAELKVSECANRATKAQKIVDELKANAEESKTEAAKVADPTEEMRTLQETIKAADKNREASISRKLAKDTLENLRAEVKSADAKKYHADEVLASLRGLWPKLLEGKDLGVDGLEMDETGLRLNGVPLKQGSLAERFTVACDIVFSQNPRLKLILLDEAEKYDRDTKEKILEHAAARGWRVMMASVADLARCKSCGHVDDVIVFGTTGACPECQGGEWERHAKPRFQIIEASE